MKININSAKEEELRQIPGIGQSIARLIIRFRETYGVVKREALNLALRGNLPQEVINMIDFSDGSDPFDFDVDSLPMVPKTDQWDPFMDFKHDQRRRERSPLQGKILSPTRSPAKSLTKSPSKSPEKWEPLNTRPVLTLPGYMARGSGLGVAASGFGLGHASDREDDRPIKPMPDLGDLFKSPKKPQKIQPSKPSPQKKQPSKPSPQKPHKKQPGITYEIPKEQLETKKTVTKPRQSGGEMKRLEPTYRNSGAEKSGQSGRREKQESSDKKSPTRSSDRHSPKKGQKKSRGHSGSRSRSRGRSVDKVVRQKTPKYHSGKTDSKSDKSKKQSKGHSRSRSHDSNKASGSPKKSRSSRSRPRSESHHSDRQRKSKHSDRSRSRSREHSGKSRDNNGKSKSSRSRSRDHSYKSSDKNKQPRSSRSRSRSRSQQCSRLHNKAKHSGRSRSRDYSDKHRGSDKNSRSSKSHSRSRDSDTSRHSDTKKSKHSKGSRSRSRSHGRHSRKSDHHNRSNKKSSRRSRSRSRSDSYSSSGSDSSFFSRSRSRSYSRSSSRSRDRSTHRSHKKGSKHHSHGHRSRSSSKSRSRSSRSKHHGKSKKHKKSKRHRHRSSRSRSSSRELRSHRHHRRSRSNGRKSRSHKHHSSSYDSESDFSRDRHHKRHGDPRKLPKSLRFDGKSNWMSFKRKFKSYRQVLNWSETESKDYLLWSLEGKALDFVTVSATKIEEYSFRKIVKKLESRFGVQELKETSKAKFRQACQKPDESLEDWADRVMTLATPAFVDLPEHHLKKEAIAKFCQGCCDKDAAKQVCFEQPSTMEEALNMVKHHQYISQAVDGKRQKKSADVSVNAVQSPSEARVEQLIASALKDFAKKLPKDSPTNLTPPKPDQKGDAKKKIRCFFCKRFGHMKKDCKVWKMVMERQEAKGKDLNGKGLDGKTTQASPR